MSYNSVALKNINHKEVEQKSQHLLRKMSLLKIDLKNVFVYKTRVIFENTNQFLSNYLLTKERSNKSTF